MNLAPRATQARRAATALVRPAADFEPRSMLKLWAPGLLATKLLTSCASSPFGESSAYVQSEGSRPEASSASKLNGCRRSSKTVGLVVGGG